MIIKNPRMTAREAAEEFARTHWDNPRLVGQWQDNRFKLVDGVKIYQVLPFGVVGWEITPWEGGDM